MAMKYIYMLKKRSVRAVYNLQDIGANIESVIVQFFGDNLKDVHVEKDYFEFTLKRCTDNSRLREMGKRLKQGGGPDSGFIRQTQSMYAIVNKLNDYIDVEFVDKGIASEDLEDRIMRSKVYGEGLPEWVNRVDYIDVYSTQLTIEEYNRLFHEKISSEEEFERERLYEVKLRHRHVDRDTMFDEKSKFFYIEHLYTEDENYYYYYDWAQIWVVKGRADNNILDKINHSMRIDEPTDEEGGIPSEWGSCKTEYIFRVHNVGQGLATSLACGNEKPFFYFDYGLAYGRNKFTIPTGTILPIKEQGIIVLSHIHQDHWCGFRTNNDALRANWFFPRRRKSRSINHLIARIIREGGTVHYHSGLGSVKIEISNSSSSNVSPIRPPKDIHQDGYAMYIDAICCDTGEPCSILVSGDQDYDYQNLAKLQDIDILVACHHGGKYCWSVRGMLPTPAKDKSIVIYSYGAGNTHGHPSKCADYIAAGWRNRFDTISGDYSKQIYL